MMRGNTKKVQLFNWPLPHLRGLSTLMKSDEMPRAPELDSLVTMKLHQITLFVDMGNCSPTTITHFLLMI